MEPWFWMEWEVCVFVLRLVKIKWENAPGSAWWLVGRYSQQCPHHLGSFHQASAGARGWLLFIHWANIYWTLVMAICPVANKLVTCGQLLATLSLATFLEGIFKSILYSSSHFHWAPLMGGLMMGAPYCHVFLGQRPGEPLLVAVRRYQAAHSSGKWDHWERHPLFFLKPVLGLMAAAATWWLPSPRSCTRMRGQW